MYGLKSIDNVNTARVATFNKTYKMNEKRDKFMLKNTIDGAIFLPCQSRSCINTYYAHHI